MKHDFIALLILVACASAHPNAQATNSVSAAPNVLPLTVGGCGDQSYNRACVSVTVCMPGTNRCQTIPNIQVDTQSVGLRIFSHALSLPLVQEADAHGGVIHECLQFLTRSAWGDVRLADIVLGGERAPQVPLQVVDSKAAGASFCAASGAQLIGGDDLNGNGILGVGGMLSDYAMLEGLQGQLGANKFYDVYASCRGNDCQWMSPPESRYQVSNPILHLPRDNNGIIIQIPALENHRFDSQMSGYMILGIGTARNNTPPPDLSVLPTDAALQIATTFHGRKYLAIIDSGCGAYYWPSSIRCVKESVLCNNRPVQMDLSTTLSGIGGGPSVGARFQVDSGPVLLTQAGAVIDNVGFQNPSNDLFIFGLPFFIGKTIYFGYSGQRTPLGVGPFFAWNPQSAL